MNPYSTTRKSTLGSAIGFLLIGIAIVGAVALMIAFPQIVDSIVWICVVIGAAILLVCLGIAILSGLLVLPMYVKKGEEYQINVSYDLDDVKDVSGKMEGKEE